MKPVTADGADIDPDKTELFNDLIKPLLGTGFGLAFAMLNDRAAAEDAVQEAAIKAWRNARKAVTPGYSPRPWFLAIVANQCRDTRRAGWWRVIKVAEVPEDPKPDDTELVADELDLDRALARLSREQRALLFMRYRLDMSPAEIAKVLALRPGTVKSRLHRGLHKLQDEMTVPRWRKDDG